MKVHLWGDLGGDRECMGPSTCEDRGQVARVSSLLPPCDTWYLNSGRQTWYQMPLSPEGSQQLSL